MPATARKEVKNVSTRTVRVVALTHAFQDLHRYRRGDELDIQVADGQLLPLWCIAAEDAPRDRDGHIKLADLPIYFPANARN